MGAIENQLRGPAKCTHHRKKPCCSTSIRLKQLFSRPKAFLASVQHSTDHIDPLSPRQTWISEQRGGYLSLRFYIHKQLHKFWRKWADSRSQRCKA